MRNPRIRPVLFVTMFFMLLASLSQVMFARVTTNAHPEVRVTAKIDNAKRTVLHGHVSSALRSAIDMGRQDPRTPSPGMIMVLKSSEEQKREIRKVIDEQQDKRTANYHQWLTPEEFGEHFGAHDEDIAKVKEWLTSQGFTVDEVSKSKRVIKFSGNLGQVENAFRTEMHLYTYRSEMHVANNREISIPEALNKVIAGVSLHNFYRKSSFERHSQIKNGGKVKFKGPKYTANSSTHYVAPADFATIYNTAPLLAAGINGTGSSIAVVGRSDIQMGDVTTYRQIFNLPPNDPTFIHAGQDNGTEPGDDSESDLDVEVSGGMAPNAKVYFVIGTPTFLVDGITNSIQYIVENNLADIMTISYGSCESVEGVGGNEYNNQAFEQAAAQGITVFIASGDNGPAACDNQNNSIEVMGYATDSESSTPYSVGVGGTELVGDAGAKFSQFWSATTNATYFSSALGYIPEYPWNDAKASTFTDVTGSGLAGLWSSSGGVSSYYLRPSWQQGPGINNASDPAFSQGGNWVTSVTLTNPGTLYTGTTTTVTFSGGTCTTLPFAGATANISGGSVATTGGLAQINFNTSSTTVPAQGLNCTVAPTVTFGTTTGTVATGTVNLGPMQNTPFLVTGVPHRLVPDIALNASASHNGTLICIEGTCDNGSLNIEGGTSVAAPTMAGVQALINQANGGRQGMPAYIYYSLAQAQATANGGTAACNSGTTTVNPPLSSANCAFDDIQTGNTFICATSTCTTSSGTKIGWTAGAGYDLTTGLGSPNVANLAAQWKNVVFNSSTTTLGISQTNIAHGTSVTLSGTVAGAAGTPTGDVAFIVSQGEIGVPINQTTSAFAAPGAFATLSGGSYSANLGNLPAGTYNVSARYGGDQTFGSSLSAPVAVTVSGGESTTVTIAPALLDGSACTLTNINTFNYGQLMFTQITVAGTSGQGIPTGSLAITVDSNPYTTVTLDPNGFGYLAAGAIPTSSCIYDYMFAQAPTLSGGVHSIGATYSGDGTFAGGTATPVSVTISPLTTAPTLSVGATTFSSGTTVPLAATFPTVTALTGISPKSSGPTGTVTFFNGATNLGTATVVPLVSFSGNTYTFSATAGTTSSLITASGTITATYSGDSNYAAASFGSVAVTVGPGTATTTTLASSANPTTLGGRPTFTATVTTATAGVVTFYDGTTLLGVGSTVGTAHTSTFKVGTTPAFVGGAHNITAVYGGSGANTASTSSVLVENVTKGTETFALTGNKIVDAASNTFTFQAVMVPSGGSTTYAPILGVATFFDGATPIGTSTPIIFTTAQGGENVWLVQVTGVTLTPGTHSITVSYTDVNYAPSTSAALVVIAAGGSVGIYSPIPSTTLAGTGNTTFKWFPVAGANYWLDIGPTQGSNVYFQSGNLGTALSMVVPNNLFPTDGSAIWARVWTLINGNWGFSDVTYSATGGSSSKGVITTPVPNSVLTGSTVTFNWNAGTGATAYWLDIGSTAGGHDYLQSGNLGNVLTKTVSGLPTNGSQVYVTLYSLMSGVWQNNAYTYTAATATAGAMISPTPGSTFTGNSATFTWTPGSGTAWWLDVGSSAGGNQYSQSGSLNVQTTTVNGLPTDGSTVYVTLYTLVGGTWTSNAYTYFAFSATGSLAVITSPTGPTLSGNAATFTWSADPSATAYWLDIGSTPGANDVYQSGNLGNVTSTNVSSLPANGNTIYTTLYSFVGGQWMSTSASYVSGP